MMKTFVFIIIVCFSFHIIHVSSKSKNIKKVLDELLCGHWVL